LQLQTHVNLSSSCAAGNRLAGIRETDMNTLVRDTRPMTEQIKLRIVTLAMFVGSIWLIFFVSVALPWLHLNRHGVVPRSVSGLQGIFFAPWLHAGLAHILANTGGLLILGWLTMWPRISNFFYALAGSMLGAGICAWLLGSASSVHIGASGVVFGLAAYLVGRGIYTRNVFSILVALVVVGTYGLSMLLGALPIYPGISWQSHLGGAIGGFIVARTARPVRP
jgi:membrane associated rhomboid family serine protease